ncbi:CoB--CoM heterodisulfide reductase iron-sulfur subunit A family protein [Natranaerobius thermophilus]|uniref:CoB--CoM heterodisulfide reductase subunit A n=1 Tax=Natranaerobius thermophilus (strain ATCC BAA-1301 / DSM 18059 / JW/NM-WN-LF) TaxID=457570 RepID=B2A2B1_NATTJ|nr:CoB--CoM heterodisulfide reductase iron-sulfur subunit A family protein [Natranaerobius thermophilus]ACB86217.1 CoB--CoM heterodisulfide reductase subunit A [Natranaerobius thermophilus JW/NM-WN-LF]
MRIGVFICWCGSNIKNMVDVERVAQEAKRMPRVVYSQDVQYLCSEVGQADIRDAIAEHNLDRVVIGACSPRMHEPTFQKLLEEQGLNPFYVEIANIREQCSWVHSDKDKATEKATELVQKAVAKSYHSIPLTSDLLDVNKRALVVGGGIAGIQAALDIAEAGYPVDLVEKEPSIGGRMAQFDKTFPTLDCSACILTPKMVEAASHENINLYTYSEIEDLSGYVGNFKVRIKQKAKSVKPDKCNGCGDCMAKCPKKVDNEFDEGNSKRKAIYTLFPQAVPNKPVLDRENCIYFQTGKCGVCQKICPTGAIDYEEQDEIIENEYGAIVAATGFDLKKPVELGEYCYGDHSDVITSLELERMLNASGPTGGKVVRPSNGETPKRIAFIQCVGSRDRNEGNPYCSKVCCLYTAKHTLLMSEKFPETENFVFNIDVRTAGKDYEEFYERARQQGANYLRGQVSKVEPLEDDNNRLLVRGYDSSLGEQVEIEADLVVLASSIEPKPDSQDVATVLGISVDQNGFFSEAHPKLRPVETQAQGVYLAGVCQGPKDIPETVAQASGASAKVITLFNKGQVKSVPTTAIVNTDICSGCMQCKTVCPYEAISQDHVEEKVAGEVRQRPVASVNRALCQGCGACAGLCRSGAMDLGGFTSKQLMAEVDTL